MSVIFAETIRRMRELELPDGSYHATRREVATEMATSLVQGALEAFDTSGDDYKAVASNRSCAISAQLGTIKCRATRKAVAEVLTTYGLLDGYSNPRAFNQGLARLLGL